jgi:hypothetical protein
MAKREYKKEHLITELSNAVYWIEDVAHDPSELHISAMVEGIHEAMKLIHSLNEKEINQILK